MSMAKPNAPIIPTTSLKKGINIATIVVMHTKAVLHTNLNMLSLQGLYPPKGIGISILLLMNLLSGKYLEVVFSRIRVGSILLEDNRPACGLGVH